MREATQGSRWKSSDLWETLEQMVRGKVQEFIQEILEDEVTEFLGGRAKSQRRVSVEGGPKGYRNGYGKPRNLTLASGTVEVCRPRVRDVEERFESRVLPLFARRTKEAAELVVQLYLHGLAEGDFELALRGLLGDGAPLSKSTVRRLRERWVAEHAAWERRSLAGRELVYAWADGIYVKAGLEKDKAALLVVIGAMADGTKEVLAVAPGFRESAESWAAVLRSLKARGLGVPKLLVADGNLGIWAAARQVWPEAGEQRCWNHKMANVLDRLPKREADGGEAAAAGGRVRGVEGRGREGSRRLRGPLRRHVSQGGRDPGRRLGPDDCVLRLPRRALEAPAHDERGRKPVRGGAAAHVGRQAVQEGRRRHGADLEAPHGRREAVPEAQRPPPAARGARGQAVRRRQARPRTGTARGLTTVCDLRSVQRGPPKDGAHQSRPGGRRGKTPTRQHRPIASEWPVPGESGPQRPENPSPEAARLPSAYPYPSANPVIRSHACRRNLSFSP